MREKVGPWLAPTDWSGFAAKRSCAPELAFTRPPHNQAATARTNKQSSERMARPGVG